MSIRADGHFRFSIKACVPSAETAPHAPAALVSGADTESLAALARFGSSDLHVLIAEDNPANRMVARLTLERFGVHVREASNGIEALSAAEQFRFDAILMDCRMPIMDGYEATRRIRALPEPAGNVPIIALTASAFKEDRIRAEQAGMNDFVAKPFQDTELVQKCFSWAKLSLPTREMLDSSTPADARHTRWRLANGNEFRSLVTRGSFTADQTRVAGAVESS